MSSGTSRRSSVKRHLIDLLEDGHIDFDLVCALGGDTEFTQGQKDVYEQLLETKGDKLYSDIIFSLTHKYYNAAQAKNLWKEIINHKWNISKILKRNVGIVVATLDYLANIENEFESPLLISKQDKKYVAEIALKDGLTNIYDHYTFYSILAKEIDRHARYGDEVSLIMIDLDDFKKLNDKFGHPEGDEQLRRFTAIASGELRKTDVIGRCGGEEFGIILVRTGSREAVEIANRIKEKVGSKENNPCNVTVSMGVATYPNQASELKDLIKKADDSLFCAKRNGKNRVEVYAFCDAPECVERRKV